MTLHAPITQPARPSSLAPARDRAARALPADAVAQAFLARLRQRPKGLFEPRLERCRALGPKSVVLFRRGWSPEHGVQHARELWLHRRGGWRPSGARAVQDTALRALLVGVDRPLAELVAPLEERGYEASRHEANELVVGGPPDGTFATLRPGAPPATGWRIPPDALEDGGRVVELRAVLSRDALRRARQIRWASRLLARLGEASARGLWLPRTERWMRPEAWQRALTSEDDAALLPLWMRVIRSPSCWTTRGMAAWMLPDVTVDARLGAPSAVLSRLMRRLFALHAERRARRLGAEAPGLWQPDALRIFRHAGRTPAPIALERLPSTLELGDHAGWRLELDRVRARDNRYGAVVARPLG